MTDQIEINELTVPTVETRAYAATLRRAYIDIDTIMETDEIN